MADSKISDLTALTSPASADQFVLVDADAGVTKKITFANLNSAISGAVAADDIGVGDAAVNIATSAGSITIDAQAGDTDIIFKGTDNTSDITALTLDMSEAGAATFNSTVTATGFIIGSASINETELEITSAIQTQLNTKSHINYNLTKTGTYTAVAGDKILCDTSGGAFTITLPASPSAGDEVHVLDATASFDSNNLTIGRNSKKIQGADADLTITTQNTGIGLVFYNDTYGWRVLVDAYDVDVTEL